MSWWLVWFSRRGPARYVSHLDTARALQRTVRRAGVVPALTQGMRPRPRISVVVPLPVGAAAREELMLMEVDDERTGLTPLQALPALRSAGAGGLRVEALSVVPGRPRPVARQATYRCRMAASAQRVATAIEGIEDAAEVLVERESPKGRKTIDVKRYLGALRSRPVDGEDEVEVEFVVTLTSEGTVRPAEVVAALAERAGTDVVAHDLERLGVCFEGLPDIEQEDPAKV
jgi:radical SAM-linked protein